MSDKSASNETWSERYGDFEAWIVPTYTVSNDKCWMWGFGFRGYHEPYSGQCKRRSDAIRAAKRCAERVITEAYFEVYE